MTSAPTRVLWIVNIILPAIAEDVGQAKTPFGGWLTLMIDRLAKRGDFQIAVAMRAPVKTLTRIERDGVTYFVMPQSASDPFDVDSASVDQVLAGFGPDILHAEGTEMAYTRRFLARWTGPKLVSLQGLINGIEPYELGRLPMLGLLNPLRPRRMVTALALMANLQFRYRPRLTFERQTLKMADHIMGRTLWDRAHAWAINPRARYHHCSRILRDVFYRTAWDAAGKTPRSIFLGNAATARKGVHFAMRAAALLAPHYPDMTIYVAGQDPSSLTPWSIRRLVGYPAYLDGLIRDLNLKDRVVFTGPLTAEGVAEQMARSHVFVLSSMIENSPNTLGEAMMVGTPSVAAFAGGVPSMARDEIEVLMYRADDPAMMAMQIKRLFDEPALCSRLSRAARKRARVTHDPDSNVQALVDAYDRIVDRAVGGMQ